MEDSALERFFENFIENDSWKTETEDETSFSSHPDENSDNSPSLNYSSQNATATDVGAPSLVCPTTPVTLEQKLMPHIHNVMSSVKLGCCLDLNLIAHKVWNIEYNPQTFKAVIMRIREPRVTALIYSNGKIICTGAKSEEQSRLGARKCARKVMKLGFPVRFLDFRILNIMATCTSLPVSLEQLAYHHPCSNEPELFPGLFFRGIAGISVIIFPSGKISLTGVKTEAEIHAALEIMGPILNRFIKI